jgi:hypothetical protein
MKSWNEVPGILTHNSEIQEGDLFCFPVNDLLIFFDFNLQLAVSTVV